MEFQLKAISPVSIPKAIAKAELYRNLNEPEEAESICLDILAVDSDNQMALRLLGLSLTDQFTGGTNDRHGEALQIFARLINHYDQMYYTGLVHERRAKAQLQVGASPEAITPLLSEAMRCFAAAEKLSPADNDDAILRWNRCVRLYESHCGKERERAELFEIADSPPF